MGAVWTTPWATTVEHVHVRASLFHHRGAGLLDVHTPLPRGYSRCACRASMYLTPHKSETVMDASYDGLMPSEVVHLATPDPAEQVPLVARSYTRDEKRTHTKR